jgi:hypothetical protein
MITKTGFFWIRQKGKFFINRWHSILYLVVVSLSLLSLKYHHATPCLQHNGKSEEIKKERNERKIDLKRKKKSSKIRGLVFLAHNEGKERKITIIKRLLTSLPTSDNNTFGRWAWVNIKNNKNNGNEKLVNTSAAFISKLNEKYWSIKKRLCLWLCFHWTVWSA